MRNKIVTFAFTVGATLAMGVLLAAPAGAVNGNDELTNRDQIVMNGRLVVAQGDTVDAAVLFHGVATIDGTVTKSVVVFELQSSLCDRNADITDASDPSHGGVNLSTAPSAVHPRDSIPGGCSRAARRVHICLSLACPVPPSFKAGALRH